MPRHKTIPHKTQVFELEGGVTVTIEFPVGSVRWQATHNAVSIATGDGIVEPITPTGQSVTRPANGLTNGPKEDTPEIAAARARLGDPLGRPPQEVKKKVFTSADAFREVGMDLDQNELEAMLTQA